jgi:hypothetical protein
MTVSTPIKIFALVAVLLGAAGMAFLQLASRSTASSSSTPPVVKHAATAPTTQHTPAVHKAPTITLDPNLPAPVRFALLHERTVVVGLYSSRTNDGAALTEMRAGAALAHTPFVAIDVMRPKYAAAFATFTGSTADPALLVVRRPGTIVHQLAGVQDRQVVAEAARDGR